MTEAQMNAADHAYFNDGMKTIPTESSVLVSSSPYLNNAQLRNLIAQEMLRRNGPDIPATAFIPEVAQILHMLEDHTKLHEIFEAEKARLPRFKEWLDARVLSDFTIEELQYCAPGTLGASIRDFMVNSGYQLDFLFREIQAVNDFTYYLRQTVLTHDIEHMISGFGPNHGGEIALLNANMHAKARYFRPELAAFFNRIPTYLKAKTLMKDGLFYPEAAALNLEAEYQGSVQARNWKYPLMLVNWRAYVDVQIDDIREELGITPVLPKGLWDDTNRLSMDPVVANDDTQMMQAAE